MAIGGIPGIVAREPPIQVRRFTSGRGGTGKSLGERVEWPVVSGQRRGLERDDRRRPQVGVGGREAGGARLERLRRGHGSPLARIDPMLHREHAGDPFGSYEDPARA